MIEGHRTFLQNRSQHGHCLNVVSCAGVLADQRFAKNPSMAFVFRTTIYMDMSIYTQGLLYFQIKIYTTEFALTNSYSKW